MCTIYNRPEEIYAWNAVDVRDSSGVMHHGRIINVVSNGLIVDFACPGRRADLVEYSTAFRCLRNVYITLTDDNACALQHYIAVERYQEADPQNVELQVLARVDANHPWTWYPVELIYPRLFWQRYLFVEIRLGEGRVVRQMIRAHSVRWRLVHPIPSEKACVIEPYMFVACGLPLPADYWGGEPVAAPLWDAWKEAVEASQHAVWPVCVIGGMVVFLHCLIGCPLTLQTTDLDQLLSEAKRRVAQQSVAAMTPPQPSCAPPQYEPLPVLPAAVVDHIFHLLDSAQRARCRRVCSLWNGLLEHPNKEVIVGFSHQRCVDERGKAITPHEAEWQRSAYMVGLSLWRCVTARTERIVISNATYQSDVNEGLADCLRLIEYIHMELPPSGTTLTLIVHKFHWNVRNWRNSGLDCLVPMVRVIWRDCTFSGPGEHFQWQPIVYGVSRTRDATRSGRDVGLFGVVEASLPELGEDAARVWNWIADADCEGADPGHRERIFQVLEDCQSWHDIRDFYPDDSITLGDGTLEVLRKYRLAGLSKLTQCGLQREMVRGQPARAD
ncbi:uncharacterized protein LOC129582757 [Paramacrobiotus metropolitanus]|uniref:uncharacterized protein LOC129582757 n=1 Tax=Paramacrobiotus metropolitanus TaxID=2943436 RepID=UPI0024465037|nr:uncharacterized protein LOC129582757 [Paramacrobiotus metropolitanus]